MRTLTTFLIMGITLALILVLYTPSPAECRPGDDSPASMFNPMGLMETMGFAPNKKKDKEPGGGMGGFGKSMKEFKPKDKKGKKKGKKKEETEESDSGDSDDSDEE